MEKEDILGGTQTEEGPTPLRKKLADASGMNIETISEEARSRKLIKTRLTRGSLKELVDLFRRLAEDAKEENPDIGIYGLSKIIVDQLPQRIPHEAQQKALQAFASIDTNTRRLGQEALLVFNLKTLLTVVDSFFRKDLDRKDDREDMMQEAFVSVQEKLATLKQGSPISIQVNNFAKGGVAKYLAKRDNYYLKKEEKTYEDQTFREATSYSLVEDIKKVLQTLTVIEKEVIELRFGLKDGEKRTLKEIGRELGVTKERIRQIEARALRKLRHPTRARRLRDYSQDDDVARPVSVPPAKSANNMSYNDPYVIDKLPDFRYSIASLETPVDVKKKLFAAGIRQIGNFFSVWPQEIGKEWKGDKKSLLWALIAVTRRTYGLYEEVSRDEKFLSERELLDHIVESVLYKNKKVFDNVALSKLTEEEKKLIFKNAYRALRDLRNSLL